MSTNGARINVRFEREIQDPLSLLNFFSVGRPGRVCLMVLSDGEYGDRQLRTLLQLDQSMLLYTSIRLGDRPGDGIFVYLFTLPAEHTVRLEHIEVLWSQVIHAAGGLSNLEVLETAPTPSSEHM